MSKKMLFVFNPAAGKSQIKNKLVQIVDTFIKAGYRLEVYATQKRQDATRVVLERGSEMDVIVCSGGDGTLNECVSGIMELERAPRIGYIPAGTTNDFAATHKIPKNMINAAELIAEGRTEKVDVGKFDDRYFVYVAGFGAFTDIPYKTPQEKKALLGHPAYILEGAKRLMATKPCYAEVEAKGFSFAGNLLVGLVSNANQIAGFKGLNGKNSRLDDGLFEVLLIEYSQTIIDFTDVITSLVQPAHHCPQVHRFTADKVRFKFKEPVDWVLDGEFGGSRTDITIENFCQAMEIFKK